MIRVADLAQFQLTMANIQRSQSTLAENQIQIATGKKAQAYSEIASQSAELVSLERSLERGDQFVDNIELTLGRLNVMESTFGALQEQAINIKGIISQGLSGNNIAEVPLQQFAATFSDEAASLLNTQFAGQYLFAGSLTDGPAVDLSDVDYDPQAGLPAVGSCLVHREAQLAVRALVGEDRPCPRSSLEVVEHIAHHLGRGGG